MDSGRRTTDVAARFSERKKIKDQGVQKEDEGTYVCTARNVYGSETASAKLTVKGKCSLVDTSTAFNRIYVSFK